MADTYRQCKITLGDRFDVAWLEDKKIEAGKKVEIKKDDGSKELWTIEAVYGTKSKDEMLTARDAHKSHRKATDI